MTETTQFEQAVEREMPYARPFAQEAKTISEQEVVARTLEESLVAALLAAEQTGDASLVLLLEDELSSHVEATDSSRVCSTRFNEWITAGDRVFVPSEISDAGSIRQSERSVREEAYNRACQELGIS